MAAMATGSDVTTAEELLELPSNQRCELVRGVLRHMTAAGHVHGRIAADILARLATFVREYQLGATYAAETGFILKRSPDTVRAPDASFVTAARLASTELQPEGYFPGPPDLAVEVISPSDRYTEVEEKVNDWLEAGCRVVIVLDPHREVAIVHRPGKPATTLSGDDGLTEPDLLPGWSVRVAGLFGSTSSSAEATR